MNIKPIPGTLGFSASESGTIYGPDKEVRPQYKNLDGYSTASVKMLDGRWQTFGVHRLVALAHLPYDGDVSNLTVNHLDTNVSNNDVDNLEWVSVHLNNLHASLMRQQVEYPTIILTDAAGGKSFIDNLHDASSLLGIDRDLAWEMVRDGREVDGKRLEPFTKRTNIPPQLRKPTIYERDANGRPVQSTVVLKDLEDGTIEIFDSMAEAALRYGVSPSHIYQCISDFKKTRLFKQRYLIVRDRDPFPDVTPEEYEEMKAPGGKQTLALNLTTNELVIFPSASSMVTMLNLSKKAVTTRLKRDGHGEVNGWLFAYQKNKQIIMDRIKSSSSP